MSIPIFTHAGSAGDVLYSLTFVKEYIESLGETALRLELEVNRPATHVEGHPYGNVLLSEEAIKFLRPLLEYQPYIESCNTVSKPSTDAFDLNSFRALKLYLSAGDLRYYYYPLLDKPLPVDFSRPCLNAPVNLDFKDKIVLFRSCRYHNPFVSYQLLRPLKDRIVFIGLPREHQDFCNQQFPVEFYKVRDALEAASIMKSAKLTIGNQTGLFAIAEQLKVPRILESCQVWSVNGQTMWGLPNVIPFGGRCQMAISDITPQLAENTWRQH